MNVRLTGTGREYMVSLFDQLVDGEGGRRTHLRYWVLKTIEESDGRSLGRIFHGGEMRDVLHDLTREGYVE